MTAVRGALLGALLIHISVSSGAAQSTSASVTASDSQPACLVEAARRPAVALEQTFDFCGPEEGGFFPICDPYVHCSTNAWLCTLSPRTTLFRETVVRFCGGCQPLPMGVSSDATCAASQRPDGPYTVVAFPYSKASLSGPTVEVASVSPAGTLALGGGSLAPVLSGDGSILAFDSAATNLVAGDANGFRDVFVRNRITGQTTRISVAADGAQGNGDSIAPVITPSGRFIAFLSQATNLVPGDTNGVADVFLNDRQTGTIERVNIQPDGQQAVLATWPDAFAGSLFHENFSLKSDQIAISDDGRYVAYVDESPQPLSGQDQFRVYLRDRQSAVTTIISPQQPFRTSIVSSSAAAQSLITTAAPHGLVTGDRVAIAGHSGAKWIVLGSETDLPNTQGGCGFSLDPYVLKHPVVTVVSATTFTIPVNVTVGGIGGTATRVQDLRTTARPRISMSGDARYIAFDWLYQILVNDVGTTATTAGTGGQCGTREQRDVYVYDRNTAAYSLVSVGLTGLSANGYSGWPSISADGRYVAFVSEANNLVANTVAGLRSVYLRDRQTATTIRIGGGRSTAPAISRDGRTVVFPDLYSAVRLANVFAYSVETQRVGRLILVPGAQTANGISFGAAVSGDGSTLAFASAATDIFAGDTNGQDDVLVGANSPPVITAQPANPPAAVIGGSGVFITVAATALVEPSYQWQASVDGGVTWANATTQFPAAGGYNPIPHGDTATQLVVFARPEIHGAKFRAVVSNAAGSVVSSSATFTIAGPLFQPAMTMDRTALQFGATTDRTRFAHLTPAQTVRLLQSGPGTVSWTVQKSAPWITVSHADGIGPSVLTVGVRFDAGLPASGAALGTVTIVYTGSSTVSTVVNVRLNVINAGAEASPTGAFDTPLEGTSGVTGSIAVTGWALDDVGVTEVRILREPVPGEGPGLVFLGNAVLVEGARTDVAAANPTWPNNTRAGWGYLLLTNFLPNQGNGMFRLHAHAYDVDGHVTSLGSRTIVCANDQATKPFGAIDTPAQGATVSGSSLPNYGWVLSRKPNRADPPHGTVTVYVDGVAVGTPAGWGSRADLSLLFPLETYPGANNALGLFPLNTTTLANGVHTIAWIVSDSSGAADGVGSRYFTVANGSSSSTTAVRNAVSMSAEIDATPLARGTIRGRRGFNEPAVHRPLPIQADGAIAVRAEELDRIELLLDGGATHAGYQRIGDQLHRLPIGSSLDATTGVFTWTPGAGFLNRHDLVFISCRDNACVRREVRVNIHPRGSNRVGPQITIDAPLAGGVPSRFLVAGWAVDLDAAEGTGIDAVHIWAYPVSGDRPRFLGAAAYGGRRPDVGDVMGDSFEAAGFGLVVEDLPAGVYDIAVFGRSTVLGTFAPARVVRVTVR